MWRYWQIRVNMKVSDVLELRRRVFMNRSYDADGFAL